MNGAVQRLTEHAREALTTHLLMLPAEDRRLRFGASISSVAVIAYVDGIDFERGAVFGVHDDELALIGAAHLAFGDDFAELGVSVLPPQRGRGVGGALFTRSTEHARNRLVSRLFMHCVSENTPIMRIARRSGMAIVVAAGAADAHLELSPATPMSVFGEALSQGLALYDYALKADAAAWRGINAARGSAPRLQARTEAEEAPFPSGALPPTPRGDRLDI